jgi:protein involved in polysaccharide export with SLBB domain
MSHGITMNTILWNITKRLPILSGRRWRGRLNLLMLLLPLVGSLSRPAPAQTPSGQSQPANQRAQAGNNPPQAQIDPTVQIATRIVKAAILTVTITDEPGLSGDYTVNEAGAIHFVISAGDDVNKVEWDVVVADKTAAEATDLVTASLKTYLKAPEVRVVIKQMPRLHVEVSGPVRRGNLNLPLGSHLSDALKAAGCDRDADYAHIILIRRNKIDGKPLPTPINFIDDQSGSGDGDPALQSGDRILLQKLAAPKPETKLQTIRILGQVAREGDVPVGKSETIKDVLAEVGGLTENADRKKVVLHRASTGKDYELDADKIGEDDPLFNIVVEPGDFIMVGRRDLTQRYGVGGEVQAASIYNFDPGEHMTVLRAIEKAGGITKKGDTHKGILRRGFLNNPLASRDLPFDAEAIRKGKARDWDLVPGDMVIVLPKQRKPSLLQNLLPIVLRFLPFGL